MKAAFYTLGCKVNQSETSALQQLFTAAGWPPAAPGQAADIFVVNSCTVTAAGEAKSRRWLHRARRENPGAVLVLTGCLPQAFPQRALQTEANVITGTAQRAHLVADIRRFLETGRRVVDIAPTEGAALFEELPAALPAARTRAFLKIQDGCNGRCAYCIVPTARGPVRSRSRQSIVDELQALAAAGCAEVVLTGINLPSYGRDTGDDLADVVEDAATVPGIRRIRLSSLDPHLVTDAQIARFAACEKLCPQFHLSLQSGCDTTLNAMRRPYTAAQYRAAAQKLRAALPHAALTTDVIVGFPGESRAHFEESLAFVKAMRFLKVHVFPFSARPGTPAATFPGQLPRAEKAARAAELQAAADGIRAEWITEQLGTVQPVLLEAPRPDGRTTGYTASYIPVLAPPVAGVRPGALRPMRLLAYDPAEDAVLAEDAGAIGP
ncbi:MAG: tRNA (N(6)-L-threonylcarbamoyladenosine(37)-C(2))-methylthiotransferase MtaB [Ruminococcaceae bacterium]|nr:tRNA (N(6)-L-threonylcarbamoyladenosine(37)-C(2))-methylthiotransferase MtaB [Oscillospiraceae bacterium]